MLTAIGFLHPLIHIGFGIEFRQPAIIAEALAQGAVHAARDANFLLSVERAATGSNSKTLTELIHEIRADKEIAAAQKYEDAQEMGVVDRAPDAILKYVKLWSVGPGELEKKTAEMIDAAMYYTMSAQKPPKQVRMDFFYMHAVNSSIFFPTFNEQPWLSDASKRRLLLFKGYLDLILYATMGCPELLMDEVTNYVPARKADPAQTSWDGLFTRLFAYEQDDGHASKFGRAIRNAELYATRGGYESEKWAHFRGGLWQTAGNMVVDSVEAPSPGSKWARAVGFDEGWEQFANRQSRNGGSL